LECLVTGPHIRTVPSSLDDAIIVGSLGFQLTQFTVLVCPLSTATGFSRFECQMYNLLSNKRDSLKVLDTMYSYLAIFFFLLEDFPLRERPRKGAKNLVLIFLQRHPNAF